MRRTGLPPELLGLLISSRGVILAAEAAAAGVSADRLQRLVRTRLLDRVGKGAYAATDQLAAAGPWASHAIRTRGFVMSRRAHTLAAGWSAVALRGLPALGQPPELPTGVHPSRTGHGTRLTHFGIVHARELPSEHQGRHAGCPIVSNSWMVVDLARGADRAAALVVADAVVHRGTARRRLQAALEQMCGWPGSDAAGWVVQHADGGSESALETLGRVACIDDGLPIPLSNVWVGPGYPLYRVDHLWPWHWVAAEADGALKYRGRDPALVITHEKDREWHLRRLGLDVVRYGWQLAALRRAELAAGSGPYWPTTPYGPGRSTGGRPTTHSSDKTGRSSPSGQASVGCALLLRVLAGHPARSRGSSAHSRADHPFQATVTSPPSSAA